MNPREQEAQENPASTDPASSYSPVPKRRRGHRRASGGSAFTGAEPKLAGLTDARPSAPAPEGQDARDTWLKEQRPPHYGQ
ncbi:MAG: hypothetical protein SPI83_03615 [Rothia sp. (in: high G+C Gram-positive bacteria)]|nr:hypothetical protein [Rothia sp. (in: high G+C Gram-positive bacteria)]